MRQVISRVLYNKKISPSYYKIGLACNEIPSLAVPGQFVMVRVSPQWDPLLGRPFCIYRTLKDSESIEILYKVVGKGTSILQEKKAGDSLRILGPLGKGFDLEGCGDDIFLVAGGIGIASFYFLLERLKERTDSSLRMTLFFGGKRREDTICLDDFQVLKVDVKITTEDGGLGNRGIVTDLLKEELFKKTKVPSILFACGPKAMLKEIVLITEREAIPCQVSLEKVMACGIGTCLGCVVKTCEDLEGRGEKDLEWEYARVCKEGPVFDSKEIVWDEF